MLPWTSARTTVAAITAHAAIIRAALRAAGVAAPQVGEVGHENSTANRPRRVAENSVYV